MDISSYERFAETDDAAGSERRNWSASTNGVPLKLACRYDLDQEKVTATITTHYRSPQLLGRIQWRIFLRGKTWVFIPSSTADGVRRIWIAFVSRTQLLFSRSARTQKTF